MPEHIKLFEHVGPRSPETDAIAEAAARHALLHEHPDIQDVTITWTHHNIPDKWLVFASGRTKETRP